jgi:YVTN family beta-propeller protein
MDQHGCMFVPRIIGIRPGQTLDLKNGDAVSHNVHPMPVNNREWNQEQAPQAPTVQHRFARPEIMIPVKCNIHAWMHSYIGVVDHPYFAVTAPEGTFEWKNVPAGDYTVVSWHEKFGKQEQQIHVAPRCLGRSKLHLSLRSHMKKLALSAISLLVALLTSCAPSGPSYRVYISNEGSGDLTVIDPQKMEAVTTVPIGKRARGIHASADGKLIYIALSGSPFAPPGVDESTPPPARQKRRRHRCLRHRTEQDAAQSDRRQRSRTIRRGQRRPALRL